MTNHFRIPLLLNPFLCILSPRLLGSTSSLAASKSLDLVARNPFLLPANLIQSSTLGLMRFILNAH